MSASQEKVLLSRDNTPPLKRSKLNHGGSQLPPDYFQLGNNMLVGVTEFRGAIYIHIRQFKDDGNSLKPTKTGITFTFHRWVLFQESVEYFRCSEPSSKLIERQIFVSTEYDEEEFEIKGVAIQYAYIVQGLIQLSRTHVRLNTMQFSELKKVLSDVTKLAERKLFGNTFKSYVMKELPNNECPAVQGLNAEIPGEKILTDCLIDAVKVLISDTIDKIPFPCWGCREISDNQEGHICNFDSKLYRNFSKAVALLSIKDLAKNFAMRVTPHKVVVSEKFLNEINGNYISDICFDVLCHESRKM
jgi:hypothetical protein